MCIQLDMQLIFLTLTDITIQINFETHPPKDNERISSSELHSSHRKKRASSIMLLSEQCIPVRTGSANKMTVSYLVSKAPIPLKTSTLAGQTCSLAEQTFFFNKLKHL